MRAGILIASALLLAPAVARADDDAGIKEACDTAQALELPKPGSAGPSPKGCDALALYDGVGGPPDLAAARACALNAAGDRDLAFPPDAVLAMIYANGDGVPRNDDLAIAYACKAGGAAAEISGRVEHLLERKRQGAAAERFDFCDDVTSGLMQGFCASRAAEKTAVARDADLSRLTAALKPQAQAAYGKLRKAFESYRDAVAEHEVDLSGTARAALAIGAREEEDDAFLATLREALGAASVNAGPSLPKADAALNAAYRKVQSEPDETRWGTVTKAKIKATQRAWIGYRDAFLAFATAAGASTTTDRLAAALTARRTESLRSFVEN